MLCALLVLIFIALPTWAEEQKVTVTFLGGAKKVPFGVDARHLQTDRDLVCFSSDRLNSFPGGDRCA